MPVKLDKPAKEVDINSPEYRTMLENLQANILKAHGRNFARHIFLRFTGARAEVKRWVRDIVAPTITTAAQQLAQSNVRPRVDGGMVSGFFLSAAGYKYLGHDTDKFASDAFRKGMKHQKDPPLGGLLGGNNMDPKPGDWEAGFRSDIHALITVADDNIDVVKQAADAIRTGSRGIGIVSTIEEGMVLRRKNAAGDIEPVEHFGYFDGISNPLFTKQDLDDELPENIARRTWDAGARLSLVLADDPLTEVADAFGSYLVYRKLGQKVGVFDERVAALAAALGTNVELAGAMVVGRFKDGTPVLQSPTASPGPEVFNDFDFEGDTGGFKCPAHAHIRKVNPRGTQPLASLEAEKRRRIVRRGIPYGKPVPGVADDTETDKNLEAQRGLLFMCFQQNVEDQFEFIQRTWVDNKRFPTIFGTETGDDPLIGQDRNEAQRWPNKWGDEAASKKAFNFEAAVTLKGGEYFFAPSIPFLRNP